MGLLFRLAWRNLLRNRRRTFITALAVAFTTATLMVTLGLMEGLKQQLLRNTTRLVIGDAQLHATGFRQERSFYQAIPEAERILAAAAAHGIVAAPRAYGNGLVSCGTKSAGAQYWSLDPVAERRAFELYRELAEGSFLPDQADGTVVLGRKLARSLNAGLGAELVAVVQAADGSLGNQLFRVRGILRTVNEEVDRGGILLHQADFDELFAAGGRIHEIAFALGERPAATLPGLLGLQAGVELLTWQELLPAIEGMLLSFDAALLIFAFIFFLASGAGVLNTMLMATHDRVREFGVLKALGASPLRIVGEIATEGLVLGLCSTAAGTALGLILTLYTDRVGIDLNLFGDATFSLSGIAYSTLWLGAMNLSHVLFSVVTMWLVCVLASLYPAIKAARIDPARAMVHV